MVRYTYAVDGSGLLTSVEDQRGYVTSYEYDELGRQTKVSQPHLPAVAPSAYVSQIEYDAAGRVRLQTDALGRQTEFSYDAAGRVTQVTVIDGVADSTPGRPGNDPNDVVATYAYEDNSDRVSIVDDPVRGATKTEYVDDQRTYREYVRVDGTWQLVRTTVLDELGRVQSVTVAGSESVPGTVVTPVSITTYTYAADGQLLSQTTSDGIGNVKSRTDFVHDPNTGRPIETIQVAGERDDVVNADGDTNNDESDDLVSTVVYDQLGRVIAQVDPLNHATLTSYDRLGRVLSQTDAESGVTSFHYDQASNRTDLTDPVGNNTHWTYDALNRINGETQQVAYQGTNLAGRSFVYDEAGHVLRRTDRNDRVIDYVYDASGRRTLEYWFAAGQAPTTPVAQGGATTNALHTIASIYDDAGRLLQIVDWEGVAPVDPAWAAGALSGYEYEYDRFDRPTQVTVHQADQPDVLLTQTYDDRSRRQSLAVQIGTTADFTNIYQYDSYDRLQLVEQSGDAAGNAVATKWAAFGYNEFGQFSSVLRGTGIAPVVAGNFQYDAYDRLQNLSHTLGSGAATGGGTEVAGYGFTYDASGRITGIAFSQHADESATFNYDATNQLTGADRAGTADDEAYDFDANGNRDSTGYITDAHNRMTEDADFTYGYDAEGNRTSKTRKSTDPADDHAIAYSWDNRNRLSAVEFRDNAGALTKRVDYHYDAFDHLIGKMVTVGSASIAEKYVYDGNQIVLNFTNGTLAKRYLWGPQVDQLIAQENVGESTSSVSRIYWLVTDHLNTVRDVFNATGGLVAHFAYNSFGKLTAAVNSANTSIDASSVTSLLYTARLFDFDTGLQNNWRRWFDPQLGKWISEDPIGFAAGDVNLTRYVGNGPTRWIDSNGLFRVPIGGQPGEADYNPATGNIIGPRAQDVRDQEASTAEGRQLEWTWRSKLVEKYDTRKLWFSFETGHLARWIVFGPSSPMTKDMSTHAAVVSQRARFYKDLISNKQNTTLTAGGHFDYSAWEMPFWSSTAAVASMLAGSTRDIVGSFDWQARIANLKVSKPDKDGQCRITGVIHWELIDPKTLKSRNAYWTDAAMGDRENIANVETPFTPHSTSFWYMRWTEEFSLVNWSVVQPDRVLEMEAESPKFAQGVPYELPNPSRPLIAGGKVSADERWYPPASFKNGDPFPVK